MTPWERKLWYCFLKQYPVKFQRQKLIGQYIVDFYCAKAEKKDRERMYALESQGVTVIRFCNLDVDKNFYGICTVIDEEKTDISTLKKLDIVNDLASLFEGGAPKGRRECSF